MKVVPLRLGPGKDLRLALEAWIGQRQLDPATGYRQLQIAPGPGRGSSPGAAPQG